MTERKRGFTTHLPDFILHPTHIIGTSEEFVHIPSGQHESVLMRVESAIESSESLGGHGELMVMAPKMVCTKTKLCRLSKNTTSGRHLFLAFFELSF